ncbi:hypothetical protein BJV74DRAFT_765562 [Russula compacta]|nr:hypothetical protein BJV74DRAFT_765562 [Russula compacta]
MLYRVHRYFFCRDSNEFVRRLSQFRSKGAVISLDDVKSKDFDAFLSVLYPLNFNASDERSFKEWTSILDLSTRWGFTTIRDLAIRCLKPPTPLQRLLLARKYGVEEWMLPALQELCERPLPLTLDEARLMDVEDIVLVGSVRETVRSHVLAVKSAGIGDCIEAWRSGKPWQRPAEERAAPAANCLAPVGVAKDPIPHHAELNGAATMSARHLDRIHGLSTASVPATITPANDAGSSVASDDEWGTWPPAKKKKGSR